MFTCCFERSNFSFDISSCSSMGHRLQSVFSVSIKTKSTLCRRSSLEPAMRFELMTSSLPRRRSTPELRGRKSQCQKTGAGDEIRTRDPQLGRLILYQLRHTRPLRSQISNLRSQNNSPPDP